MVGTCHHDPPVGVYLSPWPAGLWALFTRTDRWASIYPNDPPVGGQSSEGPTGGRVFIPMAHRCVSTYKLIPTSGRVFILMTHRSAGIRPHDPPVGGQ